MQTHPVVDQLLRSRGLDPGRVIDVSAALSTMPREAVAVFCLRSYGLTQGEVAEAMGMSPAWVHRIIYGPLQTVVSLLDGSRGTGW